MISFQPGGAVDGRSSIPIAGRFWGWPNAMRYIGVFSLAMLFPAVAAMSRRGRAWLAGVGLGALWGFTCYVSQENLVGGVLALGTLALLLAASTTVPGSRVLRSLGHVALGFAAVAVAVFAYYAANGDLDRFLQLYYLIPPAVAAGYSDTVYYRGRRPMGAHLLPAPLLLRGPLPAVARPPASAADGQAMVAGASAPCLRAGGGVRHPRWSAPAVRLSPPGQHDARRTRRARSGGRVPAEAARGHVGRRRALAAVALVAIPLAMLPLTQIENIGNRARWPLERFSYQSPATSWQRADPNSVAATPLGPVLRRDGQWCCTNYHFPVSMREFASILNDLHRVVGDRRVYVANFIDTYIPARPTSWPTSTPPRSFRAADDGHERTAARRLPRLLQAAHLGGPGVVAVYPNLPEVRMFESAYPNYRRTAIPYSWGSITVLTR